jgi:hypothetical protein
MIKRVFLSLSIVILLSEAPNVHAVANASIIFQSAELSPKLGFDDNITLTRTGFFSTKKVVAYDESKDPALRKGTENWEEPQGSYFAIPALIIGVIGLVLFFNRNK